MKNKTDIYSEARRRVLEPSQKGYTPKNCIAKTKQDCFYFQCIYNSHNGGECVREKELPADGIEHKVKVERIDRTTFRNFRNWPRSGISGIGHVPEFPELATFRNFRNWPKIMEQTAKLIKQREGKK